MVKPGYKQTEIGVIPEDWEISSLAKEYDLFAGGDLDVSDYSVVKTTTHKYCILSNGLADNGVYGFCSNPKYYGNSITITGRGDIGHCVYRAEPFSAIIRLLVCQPRSNIISKYVSDYLTCAKPFIFESTGVPQLTVPQIKNTRFPKPPVAEQRYIAEALSDVDELISSLEKLIAKKKAIKQGAMEQLLTGKTRLPGFSGEWRVCSVDDIAEFCTATVPTELTSIRHYIGTDNMISNKGGVQNNEIAIAYTAVREYRVNDILLSNIRPYLKKIWLADRSGGCSNDVLVIRAKGTETITPSFLYYLLSQDCFFEEVMANAVGTKMPRGDKAVIMAYHIQIPQEVKEQHTIVDMLNEIDNDIDYLDKKLAKIRCIKQGMMQQLLTGKVRLV